MNIYSIFNNCLLFCFPVIPYEITVFTGDKSGAGTDANVFIQMYGLKGKTEEILLRNRSDNFERKAVRTNICSLLVTIHTPFLVD